MIARRVSRSLLCVFCASVVKERSNHRDTEDTEDQRDMSRKTTALSRALCVLCVSVVASSFTTGTEVAVTIYRLRTVRLARGV
jgi:hypothetical protein